MGECQQQKRTQYAPPTKTECDYSFHCSTVIPPSALNKPNIMKHYRHWRTTGWSVTAHVRRHWSHFMILGLSSADGGMTVGLWKLSSLDGHRSPWYRPLFAVDNDSALFPFLRWWWWWWFPFPVYNDHFVFAVQAVKAQILERVDSVTSDGATSGDEAAARWVLWELTLQTLIAMVWITMCWPSG